ncbi:MAG: hypothetical protein GC153_08130 [Alphaproteobacteria bacterium]|nr:hypothetical protein [Alphaproteobacteria bacterium]
MNAQTETFEEEYEEYDEFDDDEDGERGLSGLVVLLMGIVMLGAFASVVWIAYEQGVKTGGGQAARNSAPYVAAEPGPVKIENKDAQTAKTDEPAVYDKFDGQQTNPVETLAAKPEEPVDRTSSDPIAAIATKNPGKSSAVDDAVADRIAKLAAASDAAAGENDEPQQNLDVKPATPATKASDERAQAAPAQTTKPAAEKPAVAPAPAPARTASVSSGDYVVQVAAVGSDAEADQTWSRLERKLGDYLSGKSMDVERADLGAKGVFYRVRIASFATADDAKTYCEGLKSRGQDCLVKSK